jgi:hypothetical protein
VAIDEQQNGQRNSFDLNGKRYELTIQATTSCHNLLVRYGITIFRHLHQLIQAAMYSVSFSFIY